MLRCSTLPYKFCQATMTAITWLKENKREVLLVLLGLLSFTILPAMSVGLWLMSMCSSHTCYLRIKVLPAFIPMALSFCIIYFAHPIFGPGKCYYVKTSTVVEVVFSKFVKKRNSNNSEEEEEKLFVVLDYEVKLEHMRWLFPMLVQATLLALAQFWDDFLLEVSSSCSTDSILHCFYITNLNTTDLNTTTSLSPYQELNCSNLSQVEEATFIVCYQYVFRTGRAVASAIGMISAAGLIIYTVCIVFLKVLRLSKCPIIFLKFVAVIEVLSFCAVLSYLQVNNSSQLQATHGLEILNSVYKTSSMGLMIIGSIFFLPVDKFTKVLNRTNNYSVNNEPLIETE